MLQNVGGSARENRAQRAFLREEAYHWFFGRSDFEAWCDDAGYLPEAVRAKAKILYDKGWPKTRADLTGATEEQRRQHRNQGQSRRNARRRLATIV